MVGGGRGRRCESRRRLPGLPREALASRARPAQAHRSDQAVRVLPSDRGLRVIVATDGASRGNPGPAGIGVQITDDDGTVVAEIALGLGGATNNQAEYTQVLEGPKGGGGAGRPRGQGALGQPPACRAALRPVPREEPDAAAPPQGGARRGGTSRPCP